MINALFFSDRPKRGGSNVKDFNLSVMSNMSTNKDLGLLAEKANEKVDKEVKPAKKTVKKTSKLNLMDGLVKLELIVWVWQRCYKIM